MLRAGSLSLIIFLTGLGLEAQVALGGLYTPLQLGPGYDTLYWRDYLVDRRPADFALPPGLGTVVNGKRGPKDTLVLNNELTMAVETIALTTERGRENLPLFASQKKKLRLRFPADSIEGKEVRVIGSFNNWNRGSAVLEKEGDAYIAEYHLAPGTYEYKLFIDGEELLDPGNPQKVSNGMGSFNNILEVVPFGPPCGDFTVAYADERFLLSPKDSQVPVAWIALWNNQRLPLQCDRKMPPSCRISIPDSAFQMERSYLRIYSFWGKQRGRDQLIPLHYGKPVSETVQLSRLDWHQARMYFLMVDRFYNADPGNDEPVNDPDIQPQANYLGGDLRGVFQKIEAGYFEELGVNTIWLSPITQNPLDAWGYWDKGEVKSKFSGYHGYWPISNLRIDHRFGEKEIFEALLASAHQRESNVILDYVANHVHLQHPVYQDNPEWATELMLPDGRKNTELWDEQRLTTWFDDHLPTLDLRRKEVVDPMVDSALFWLTEYDLDGFRHDATKHIDELYWRELTYKIRKNTDRPVYQIGETYGSPALINSYLSTGMLDAQFDFNLYDAAVRSFALSEDLDILKRVLEQGWQTYGYHHLMGNISGNQDRSRFISLASGDVRFDEDQKLAGWEREIPKAQAVAYRRLAMLHLFNNAVPGIPCLYYGDEIGLPGANDPDNRRMMYFENWDEDEQKLYAQIQAINHLRATQLPLIYGAPSVEILNEKALLIRREYLGEEIVVLFNLGEDPWQYDFTEANQRYRVLLTPEADRRSEKAASSFTIPVLSYLVLTAQP